MTILNFEITKNVTKYFVSFIVVKKRIIYKEFGVQSTLTDAIN